MSDRNACDPSGPSSLDCSDGCSRWQEDDEMLVPPPPPQDFNDGIEAMEGCYFDICCLEDYLTTPFHVKDIWVHTIVIG